MSAINVFQQNPGAEAKAQSPLHHADLASLVGKGRKNAGVTLRERKFLGHLTLRGDGHNPEFAAGVHKALGLELPVALTVVANNDMSLQWVGPDEWLLIVPVPGTGGRAKAARGPRRPAHPGGQRQRRAKPAGTARPERARSADEIHKL